MENNNKKRVGRQTPTAAYTLEYTETSALDAIDLYNKGRKQMLEWQEALMADIMARNEDGLWTHTKFGFMIPRRNGKSELLLARAMYSLMHGEKVLWTAHRTATSHEAYERLMVLLDDCGFKDGEHWKALKQRGFEEIRILDPENPKKSLGVIHFRTRSSKLLGLQYDLIIYDEAQELRTDEYNSARFSISDSENGQQIFTGTGNTNTSAGDVFMSMRDDVFGGKSYNTGWAEWGTEVYVENPRESVDVWYETNPSLGLTNLTERDVFDEITADVLDFNIQRLGFITRASLKSDISETDWKNGEISELPKFTGPLHFGVKVGNNGLNISLSLSARIQDSEDIFIECLDCRPVRAGIDWVIDWVRKCRPATITIDGASKAEIIKGEIKNAGVKDVKVIIPSGHEYIMANSIFEAAVFDATVKHMEQPSVNQIATAVEKRAIGSNGGFGYKSISQDPRGPEIAILESLILAHWGATEYKEKKKVKVL